MHVRVIYIIALQVRDEVLVEHECPPPERDHIVSVSSKTAPSIDELRLGDVVGRGRTLLRYPVLGEEFMQLQKNAESLYGEGLERGGIPSCSGRLRGRLRGFLGMEISWMDVG